MIAKPSYQFSELTDFDLERAFHLKRQKTSNLMERWLEKSEQQTIETWEAPVFNILHEEIKLYHGCWNDADYQAHFIFPLLAIIRFNVTQYQIAAFVKRQLKVDFEQVQLHGRVDWMVASGKYHPEHPFFFVHEYKKELNSSGEPTGQLLATMFAAQHINQTPISPNLFNPTPTSHKDLPLYGCYVLGRLWHFVTLKNTNYFISKAYNTEIMTDLIAIIKLLKAQKAMIIEYVSKINNSSN